MVGFVRPCVVPAVSIRPFGADDKRSERSALSTVDDSVSPARLRSRFRRNLSLCGVVPTGLSSSCRPADVADDTGKRC